MSASKFVFFTKMEGNGNDFVLIDETESVVLPEESKSDFSRKVCQRCTGIGANGVLILSKSKKADFRMRLFEQDGSESDMCGNGIRCLAKYIIDNNYSDTGIIKIETNAGIRELTAEYRDGKFLASVDMGEVVFYPKEIIGKETVHACNTGVIHAIVFTEDAKSVDITRRSPPIRYAPCYKGGANVNYVQVTGPDSLYIRTFEYGVEAETLSCGTGSTASAVMAARLGLVHADIVHVETPGGALDIEVKPSPIMTGTAKTVFSGYFICDE